MVDTSLDSAVRQVFDRVRNLAGFDRHRKEHFGAIAIETSKHYRNDAGDRCNVIVFDGREGIALFPTPMNELATNLADLPAQLKEVMLEDGKSRRNRGSHNPGDEGAGQRLLEILRNAGMPEDMNLGSWAIQSQNGVCTVAFHTSPVEVAVETDTSPEKLESQPARTIQKSRAYPTPDAAAEPKNVWNAFDLTVTSRLRENLKSGSASSSRRKGADQRRGDHKFAESLSELPVHQGGGQADIVIVAYGDDIAVWHSGQAEAVVGNQVVANARAVMRYLAKQPKIDPIVCPTPRDVRDSDIGQIMTKADLAPASFAFTGRYPSSRSDREPQLVMIVSHSPQVLMNARYIKYLEQQLRVHGEDRAASTNSPTRTATHKPPPRPRSLARTPRKR